jgi:ADP-dependent phosphofructokinase/glucokinase
MQSQKIEKSGHLYLIQEVLIELSYLHNTLLNMSDDVRYKELYETAVPHIEEFKQKSNLKDKNHIEIIFHALYMKLLLRLQKKEISAETEEAFDSMRILAAYLGRAYHQMKNGTLNFFNN